MQDFENYEAYEKFLNEYGYLKENMTLPPLQSAKVAFLRKNSRNQRDVDAVEYKYLIKEFKKKNKLQSNEEAKTMLDELLQSNEIKM